MRYSPERHEIIAKASLVAASFVGAAAGYKIIVANTPSPEAVVESQQVVASAQHNYDNLTEGSTCEHVVLATISSVAGQVTITQTGIKVALDNSCNQHEHNVDSVSLSEQASKSLSEIQTARQSLSVLQTKFDYETAYKFVGVFGGAFAGLVIGAAALTILESE